MIEEKKGLDKYDVAYNKWTDISDDVIGTMFVFSTKNWTISYGNHWEKNDYFMITIDKDEYYLESDSKKIILETKNLLKAKKIAHKIVENKLKITKIN